MVTSIKQIISGYKYSAKFSHKHYNELYNQYENLGKRIIQNHENGISR